MKNKSALNSSSGTFWTARIKSPNPPGGAIHSYDKGREPADDWDL